MFHIHLKKPIIHIASEAYYIILYRLDSQEVGVVRHAHRPAFLVLLVTKAFIIVTVLSEELLEVKYTVEFSVEGGVGTQTRAMQEKNCLVKQMG